MSFRFRGMRGWPRTLASSAMGPDVWLLLACAAIGTAVNLVAGQRPLDAAGPELVGSIVELVPVLVLVRFARRRLQAGRPLSVAGLILGTALAATLGAAVTFSRGPGGFASAFNDWFGMTLPAALFVGALEIHARAARAQASAHAARELNARLAAELQEARARQLEAQIEPHFLFNTLANVRHLQRMGPGGGLDMLSDLIEYLEVSLPSLRSERSTLGQEQALVAAYLRLHRPRFGSRLRFAISFPDPLLRCEVPSMMVLTLVENAVKHGLAPLPEGGTIELSAESSDRALVITVADTGAGMGEGSGGGTGLANIRSRLALRYGTAAGLTLNLNEPRGVRASLRVPLSGEARS